MTEIFHSSDTSPLVHLSLNQSKIRAFIPIPHSLRNGKVTPSWPGADFKFTSLSAWISSEMVRRLSWVACRLVLKKAEKRRPQIHKGRTLPALVGPQSTLCVSWPLLLLNSFQVSVQAPRKSRPWTKSFQKLSWPSLIARWNRPFQ